MKYCEGIVTSDPDRAPDNPEDIVIFAPAALEACGGLPLELSTLPLCDLNGTMFETLKQLAGGPPRPGYCAVFALDPLLNRTAFVQAVRAAGFRGLCNFPPLPKFETEEEAALEASGYSPALEIELLSTMVGDNLDMAVIMAPSEFPSDPKLNAAYSEGGPVVSFTRRA